jgi:aminoglycoside phosphotransferase (APT) family kinase protein
MPIDQIVAIVKNIYPKAEIQSVERLVGGVSAEVYRIDLGHKRKATQKIVFRMMGKSGLQSAQEFSLISKLWAGGVPVPRPLFYGESGAHFDRPFVIMEFVDSSSEIPIDIVARRLETMAVKLADIHSFPIESLPDLPLRLDPLEGLLELMPEGGDWQLLLHFECQRL